MIFYLYVFLMLYFFMMFMLFGLFLLMNKLVLFIEYELFKLNSLEIHFIVYMDWISMIFMSIVLIISMSVIIYSVEYMSGDWKIKRFMLLVLLFIISMMLMIISPNMISIMLGWDGLGLVSYCLVIYYQNEKSFNSGMVTILTNRMGDILILMIITMMLFYGGWDFMFMFELDYYILMMVILASFTKSAQIPFSSWLPMAMAAPTPVSSLVHSSTLVTAGIYLLIRFNYLIKEFDILIYLMMFISLMTLMISGMSANFEFDFKKIIAFSTLSQLGLMVFSLQFGMINLTLFHLLMHALFKSMLFMCAGILIHYCLNNQDIRFISFMNFNLPSVSMVFNCSSLALCGLPFLSGFFSKDLILETFLMSNYNKCAFFFLFMSMSLTLMYSLRLMFYSFMLTPKIMFYMKFNLLSSKMFYSMMILYFFTVFMGLIMSWLLFSMKNLIFLTLKLKLILYKYLLFSMIFSYFIFKINMNFFNKINLMKFMYLMWFMSIFHKIFIKKFFSGLIFVIYLDYYWIESFSLNMFNKLVKILNDMNYIKILYYIFFFTNLMFLMFFIMF